MCDVRVGGQPQSSLPVCGTVADEARRPPSISARDGSARDDSGEEAAIASEASPTGTAIEAYAVCRNIK